MAVPDGHVLLPYLRLRRIGRGRRILLSYILSRVLAIVVARLHIARNCHHRNTPRKAFALRAFAFATLAFVTTAFQYTILCGLMDRYLGQSYYAPSLIPGATTCLCEISGTVTLTPLMTSTCMAESCTHECKERARSPAISREGATVVPARCATTCTCCA
jgi:hypothetical protein